MLRFTLLGSGSSGNALLIRSNRAKILIDSGLSYKQLIARAAAVGQDLDSLHAVFVTHEHTDHVQSLGTLARRQNAPVYMTPGTYAHLPSWVGTLPRVELVEAGETVEIEGLSVASFSVSHDAADPVSYAVQSGDVKLGLAADLGYASNVVKQRLTGCHALILESNYCPELLRNGAYPPQVQQRIRGRHGHLSNIDAVSLLAKLAHDALRLVILVHISEQNNSQDRALSLAERALAGRNTRIHVAAQDKPTELFEIAV